MLSKIKTSVSWLAGAILAIGLTSQMYTSFVSNTEDQQAQLSKTQVDQRATADIITSKDSRVYQISDCVSLTAFYAVFAATQGITDESEKFIVQSYAWQHALKTIGATDGYTDEQLSEMNQSTMTEYENAMASMSMVEFARVIERKSNSCIGLMTSSDEIGAAYLLGSNSSNTFQTQPVHFGVMPSPETFNVSCTQVRTYNATTDDKLLGNVFLADAELIFDGVKGGFSDHQKERYNLYYVSEGLNRDMAPTPTYVMMFMNRAFLSDADFTLTIVANNRTSRAAIGTNVDLFISKRQGGQIVSKTMYLDCERI